MALDFDCDAICLHRDPCVAPQRGCDFEVATNALRRVHVQPNHAAVVYGGRRAVDVAPQDLPQRIRKYRGPAKDVGFELSELLPKYSQQVFGWSATTNISSTGVVVVAGRATLGFRNHAAAVASAFSKCETVRYGYVISRPLLQGPVFFAHGVVAGLGYSSDEWDQAEKITRWSDELRGERRYSHDGLLRDVFPVNFLSVAHLQAPVGDQTLAEWIADGSRGLLAEIGGGLSSWTLNPEQIPDVRDELVRAGKLIAYL